MDRSHFATQKFALLCMAVLLIVTAFAFAAHAEQKGHELIVEPSGPDAVPDEIEIYPEPHVAKSRLVNLDLSYLLDETVPEGDEGLILNLFDDAYFFAVKKRLVKGPDGRYTWYGGIAGVKESQVIIVVNGEQATGNITMYGEQWQIRPVEGGLHEIIQIDQLGFPEESPPLQPDSSGFDTLQADAPPPIMGDSGAVIDVMVVYTAAAAASVANIQNEIELAVAETNQSYENSGVTQRINLVHTAQVDYPPDPATLDFSTALRNLTFSLGSTYDPTGYMDEVHILRDQYKADLVVLLVENISYCGIAWRMDEIGSYFEEGGFSVVSTDCATGYYSFGHEMGHNMAAKHDCYVDTDTYPYEYAHGYVNPADQWRTVMAYNNQCSDSGFYCYRLPYWSNPNVLFNGDPMGASMGDCQADNHRVLNNTAMIVANFRQKDVISLDLDIDFMSIRNFDEQARDKIIFRYRFEDFYGAIPFDPENDDVRLMLNADQLLIPKGSFQKMGNWCGDCYKFRGNIPGAGYLNMTMYGNRGIYTVTIRGLECDPHVLEDYMFFSFLVGDYYWDDNFFWYRLSESSALYINR